MSDVDTLLHEEGARWRETQLPPVVDWTVVEAAAPLAGGRTRSALLAVAAAVAAVLVGSLLWRPWSGAEVADPIPTTSSPGVSNQSSSASAPQTPSASASEASSAPGHPGVAPSAAGLSSCRWDDMAVDIVEFEGQDGTVGRDISFTPSRKCSQPAGTIALLAADGSTVTWDHNPVKIGANIAFPGSAVADPQTPLHVRLTTVPGAYCVASGEGVGVATLTISGNDSSQRVDGLDLPQGCTPMVSPPYVAEMSEQMANHALIVGDVRLFGGPMGPDGKQMLNGAPGPGMEVIASFGGDATTETTSDADGLFAFLVTPGTYTLSCSGGTTVTLAAGETSVVECDVPVP